MSSLPSRRGRPVNTHAAFRRIANALRDRLLAGEWKQGDILPSFRILAKQYRISMDVVRLAMAVLRQEERVGITARRRMAVRSQRTPVPDMSPDRGALLIATHPLEKAIAAVDERDVLLGILAGAGKLRVPLTILHTYYLREALPTECLDRPWCGILLYGAFRDELLKSYQRLPFPVVLIDQPSGPVRVHNVCVDNLSAAREATERFLNLGHRKIGFLRRISRTRAQVDPDSMERQLGFLEAYRNAGLPRPRDQIFSCLPSDSKASPVFLAAAGPDAPFTALLCADAGLASMAREVARFHGKRIPQDLSIACFQPTKSPTSSGPCSDFFALGQHAVELLNRTPRPPFTLRLPAYWKDRGTVAEAVGKKKKKKK